MAAALPPGVSEREFALALEAFAAAVGADAVVAEPDGLAEYRDPYPFGPVDEFAPAAVVMPQSVEEIQAVLRVANEHRIPLWTVSAGMNNAYGGAAPRVRGSVVLHLQRMKRVLDVNEELAYAVVEPGVQFFDLYDHLRAGGYRLMLSSPHPGWGSVIGNTLERGVGYTPNGDHSANVCGLEVVLANGDVIRTGLGAVPNGRSWHVHRHGFGPSPDGLFMQSNFGIVTKMGVWLTPMPERFASCWLSLKRQEDLVPLVETLRPLLLQGIIQNLPLCGNALAAAGWLGSRRADLYQGEGSIPRELVQGIAERLGIGWWTLRFALYGTQEMVDLRLRLVEEAFSRIEGAELTVRTYAGDASAEEVEMADQIQVGIPGLNTFQMLEWPGGVGAHLDYAPLAPLTGEEAARQYEAIERVTTRYGFDCVFIMVIQPRSFIQTHMIFYDLENEEQMRRARDLHEALMDEMAKLGHSEYRSHVAFMDGIAAHYDWNGHALARLNETLKDALDPNGILSPGKQGIWPRALRPTPPA